MGSLAQKLGGQAAQVPNLIPRIQELRCLSPDWGRGARRRCREVSSCCSIDRHRLNPLLSDDPPRMGKTGRDIFPLEERIRFDDFLRRITGCEHAEKKLDSDASATNDRLASPALRSSGDSQGLQQD